MDCVQLACLPRRCWLGSCFLRYTRSRRRTRVPAACSSRAYVSPVWQPSTPAHSLLPSPYTTQRRDIPGARERRLLATPTQRDSGREQPFRTSYISVFGRVLGAYSPYRGLSLPPDLTRFECKAAVHHFGNDCPTRFARVRGETRPGGWPIDGPGVVSKNQAGLLGAYSLYRGLSLSPI